MDNNTNYISTATNEMYRWFDILNGKFFDGELEKPVITIQKARANNYGHFTLDRVWTSSMNEDPNEDGAISFYEINVNSMYLSRDPAELCGTLLHEMCHLHNKMKDIKDCSGKIHNKKFKAEAERVGFEVERDKKVGWGYTSNSETLNKFISETVKPDAEAFKLHRAVIVKDTQPKEKKTFKYVCPNCGQKLSGKTGCNVICGICNTPFEMED